MLFIVKVPAYMLLYNAGYALVREVPGSRLPFAWCVDCLALCNAPGCINRDRYIGVRVGCREPFSYLETESLSIQSMARNLENFFSKLPQGTIFLPGNRVTEHPINGEEPGKFLFEVAPDIVLWMGCTLVPLL
ncbi:UNVERIFIED_CONTAM: hypothetical protein FKN15_066987 [Acipenser sinensis]